MRFANDEFFVERAPIVAESAPRAPMISLKELYRVYTTIAAKPGEPVPLSEFKMPAEETEKLFSVFDEDYHISRFFHFSNTGGRQFSINGESATHVSIDPEISSIF
ncbi:MAG TPA: hypothetical protein VIW23_14730 [Candidatus Acidoferrum sp.]